MEDYLALERETPFSRRHPKLIVAWRIVYASVLSLGIIYFVVWNVFVMATGYDDLPRTEQVTLADQFPAAVWSVITAPYTRGR